MAKESKEDPHCHAPCGPAPPDPISCPNRCFPQRHFCPPAAELSPKALQCLARDSLGNRTPPTRASVTPGKAGWRLWRALTALPAAFNHPSEPHSVFVRPPTEFPKPKINLRKGLVVLAKPARFGPATSLFPREFSTGLRGDISLLLKGGWRGQGLGLQEGGELQMLQRCHYKQEQVCRARALPQTIQ